MDREHSPSEAQHGVRCWIRTAIKRVVTRWAAWDIRRATAHPTAAWATIFASEGITVTKIPPRSPNCNPHAERFIRSVREEYTNRVLIFDRGHSEKILQL